MSRGPINPFDFFCSTAIHFGRGRLSELGRAAAEWGGHALLVTGGRSLEAGGLLDEVLALLSRAGVAATRFQAAGEPDVEAADAGAALARREGCDLVVAVGGGSVMDAAKAVAALATNGGVALDYMEVIGRGRPLTRPGLPLVAVPTTAGTGAEVTRNAVLGHAASRRKASLRSRHLLPRVALVDPALTDTLPPAMTAASGLDAVTQLIEALLSRRANPMAAALALDGLSRAVAALPRAFADGADRRARDDMALAALQSGLALGSAGLGAVHGFSGPLGGRFPIPHGLACAALLPHAFAVNAARIMAGDGGAEAARRLAEAAAAILEHAPAGRAAGRKAAGGPRDANAGSVEDAAAFLHDLCASLGVPRLREYGVGPEHVAELVRESRSSSSMRTNPIDLSDEELAAIVRAAI